MKTFQGGHPLVDAAAWEDEAPGADGPLMLDPELRRRAEDLAAANQDLASLLASSQFPGAVLDADMRLRRFTPAAEKALGLGASDLGRPLSELALAVEAPGLVAAVADVLEGLFLAKQMEVHDRKGRWYTLGVRAVRRPGKGVEGAVLSLVDVTQIRSAQLALEASHDYAEAIVDAVNNSLVILNRHLKVKRASRFYHRLFQESPDGIVGRSLYELGGGRWNVPSLRKHLTALVNDRTPFSGWEGDFDVPKLGRRTLTVSGSAVPTGPGGDLNVVLAVEDVSLRNAAAEAAVLRRSEARQRDFVANVSHELLTPITAIKGYSESLAAGAVEVPARRAKFVSIIEKHADRLTQLVEDLLELSAYDAGRARAASESVPLRAGFLRMVRSMAPLARKRKVSVRVRIADRLKVAMSRAELNQVMQNLCENALKYNRANGRVYVNARKIGKRAVVSVQDTGIGIPKDDLTRVFDRFHRAENARLKTARGNGLGLSIVRSILLHHGCRVWAESVEGKGTIVHFTLPLAGASRR